MTFKFWFLKLLAFGEKIISKETEIVSASVGSSVTIGKLSPMKLFGREVEFILVANIKK